MAEADAVLAEALRVANAEAAADNPLDIKPDIVAMRADMDRTKSKPINQEIALATTSAIDKLSGMMAILANSFNNGPVLTAVQQTAWKDETNKIKAINNIALQQAQAAVTNERRVESPPTVTTIFTQELAAPVDNCNNIKILKLPLYNGDEDGNVACLLWLNKIMTAANTGKLTHRATIDLPINRSESVANSKIRQCKRAGMSLTYIVVKLETAFAKVPPPAEARVQVNNMTPNEREDLAHFACRLADLAQIAARDIKPEEERKLAEARMCKTNYLRKNSDDHSDEEPPISEPEKIEALQAPKKPPDNYFNIRLIQCPNDSDECLSEAEESIMLLPKSIGSPTVEITICLGKHRCIWHACIDTGSERTVCTLPCALDLVGDRLQFLLQHPANMPNLRSASGHPLKIMGVLNTKIKIGKFQIQHPVIVYDGPQREALLGNDVIKGNLIIDRSEKLKFADSTITPVDIKYRSHAKLGSTLTKTIIGPSLNCPNSWLGRPILCTRSTCYSKSKHR
jgi:hypothetical protein